MAELQPILAHVAQQLNESTLVQYRDIPGHPGYRAGDDGSIWSRWRRGQKTMFDEWRELKQLRYGKYKNYLVVTPHPAKKMRPVHQLVLEAFVGPRPDGMVCCHGDGNPQNNKLTNLRWDTPKANCSDVVKHRGFWPHGTHRKLTEGDVREIRRVYRVSKISHKELGRRHGVSVRTIGRVLNSETYADVI